MSLRRGRRTAAEQEQWFRDVQWTIWESAARRFARNANRAKQDGKHALAAEWAAAVEDAHHKATCQKYWRAIA